MVADVKLTKTEQKMYDLLCTGAFVTNEQLAACLWDEMAEPLTSVRMHLCNMRKRLRPQGLDVFSRNNGGSMGYIMARLINKRE